MLTVQEVGTEILGEHPRKFYVFVGTEYGIKQKYIRKLRDLYGEQKEAQSVDEVLSFMSTKHLIKPDPACYVVRYDDDFVSSLDNKTADKIKHTKIIGTVVCIYQLAKHADKLAKYLPDMTVSLDSINKQFVSKYLHQDFPSLPDRLISAATQMANDYNHAYNICNCMTHTSIDHLYGLSDSELQRIFGVRELSTDQMIKIGVASRNFNYLIDMLDTYPDSLDSIIYTVLSTMLELEKIISNKNAQSNLREYLNRWTHKDIYNMFMNAYNELQKLRTVSSNTYESLIYLFSLLQFSEIPEVGELA